MTNKLLLSLLPLSICVTLAAQNSNVGYQEMMHDPSYNFYEVVNAAEEHFKEIDKGAKGSGWKPFERWKYQNEYKFYPDGDRKDVDPFFAERQYLNFLKKNPVQKSLFSGNWVELGPSYVDSITLGYSAGLGRIEDLYVDPNDTNRLYIGSRSGGFWRSIDGGLNWEVTSDSLIATGVNTFAVSPTNSDSILINIRNARNGTSHGIYRSTDGGLSWSSSGFNPTSAGFGGLGTNFQILDLAYHPRVPNLIFIATNEGIFRSTDNLNSWTRSQNQYDIKQIVFHPTNDSILYLYNESGTSSTADQVLRSLDQGSSYSLSNPAAGNNLTRSVWLSTSPDCPSCLYFASNNGVWRSVDEGLNFLFLSNPAQSCDGFVVNDLDTSNMIYGYLDLENSFDGGKSFTQRTDWYLGNTNAASGGFTASYENSTDYVHADLRNAICVNGVFYIATDGHLAKSNDGGVNWQRLNEGTGIRENYCLGVSQNNHFRTICGSQDNGTSIYTEKGWLEFYGADGMEAIYHPLNHNWLMSSIQYGTRRSSRDGGFSQKSATPSSFSNAYWVAPLAYDPNQPMRIYDFRDRLYRSDDFGENWAPLGNPTFSGDIQNAAIAEYNSDIMIVSSGGSIEKSTDGGMTFGSIRNGIPNYMIEDIAFDPRNDDNIIVVYGRYQNDGQKVFLTRNGGGSWTNITHNLGDLPIRSVVIDHDSASNIYLGAEIGVYTMPMNGSNWSLYNPALPNVSMLELEINYGSNTLRAASWGRGLWEYSLLGRSDYPAITRTSITDPPTDDKPKFSIDQFVNSSIQYNDTLSAVYLEWSKDSAVFGNRINMTNVGGNDWRSSQPLPHFAAGSLVYFKVFAVGSAGDTTETYKYVYEIKPLDYCNASGNTNSGNLFINNFTFDGVSISSQNSGYSFNSTPIATLWVDSVYQIQLDANTAWSSNDFASWIDFDNDRNFDSTETIMYSPNSGSFAADSFKVPINAAVGDTVLLRNRLSYWVDPAPCGDEFGEVEDYLVVLRSISTELDEILNDRQFAVYPNPNEGKFWIEFEDQLDQVEVRIYNSLGQIVSQSSMRNGNRIQIDTELAPSYYILEVITKKGRSTQSLIIEE